MNNIITRKVINFGKIAYTGNSKSYPVTIEVELRKRGGDPTFTIKNHEKKYTGKFTPEYIELAICGNIWNTKHTDIYCGGQCLDTIAEHVRDMYPANQKLFVEIYEIWRSWHLNSMHAGTPRQEEAIRKWEAKGNKYEYSAVCEMLKKKKLYTVIYTGKTVGKYYNRNKYTYGHGWIVQDIPQEVIDKIMAW